MALTKFNVNDYIQFEENEHTRNYVTKCYRELYGKPDVDDKVDWFMNYHTKLVDGKPIMRMQFHEFASIFGYYMIAGSQPCIKDNNLYFETEDDDSKTRLLAEFVNFRRRTEKEKLELVTTANTKLLTSLTEVYDDLDRAFYGSTWGKSAVVFADGIHKIFGKFKKILADYGLEQYSPEHHAEFNPEEHEAISCTQSQQPRPVPANCYITDVMQKGYKVFGKVIKHAKVVVSNL